MIVQALTQVHPALAKANPAVTRVRVLPPPTSAEDITHGGALPILSPEEISRVKGWMDKDVAYEAEWRRARTRLDGGELRSVGGQRAWYEREWGEEMSVEDRRMKLEVVWPADGRQAREKRKDRKEIKMFVLLLGRDTGGG